MHRLTYDIMRDQVRAIYQAVTGAELPEKAEVPGALPLPAGPEASEVVSRRFAELDAYARLLPGVAARVPPFAFAPLVDVVEREKELVVEVALPGVTKDDVQVELSGGLLVITGVRAGEPPNGRGYRYAEIPRGPFRRVLALPPDVSGDARRVEVEHGVARIRLHKTPAPVAKA